MKKYVFQTVESFYEKYATKVTICLDNYGNPHKKTFEIVGWDSSISVSLLLRTFYNNNYKIKNNCIFTAQECKNLLNTKMRNVAYAEKISRISRSDSKTFSTDIYNR